MTWRDQAACLAHDPELFFPVGTTRPAEHQVVEAKRICASCPVSEPCLEWAVEVGADYGVWGGVSESERHSRRRQNRRRRAAAGANL